MMGALARWRLGPGRMAALGVTAAVAAYVLGRGATLLHAVPPWQGPDEPGHVAYALLLARGQRPPAGGDILLERDILDSMSRHGFYGHLGIAAPARPPRAFAEVARLGGDPTQLDSETPVGYSPYAVIAALQERAGAQGIDAALALMRRVSLALAALTAAAALFACRGILGRGPAACAAAVAVAAAPMIGFAGSVVNNDLTAALLATAWFAWLARQARGHATPAGLAILVCLALLAAAAKRTGLYLLPMTAIAVAWLALLPRPGPAWRPSRRSGAALALLAVAAVGLAAWPLGESAAGWSRDGEAWGADREAGAGRSGGAALRIVDDDPDAWQYLWQSVAVSGGEPVKARVWLRAPSGPADAALVVNDDAGTWLSAPATVTTSWQELAVAGRLAPTATVARIALVPGTGTAGGTGDIRADDASLEIAGIQRIANGGAESPLRLGSRALGAVARYTDLGRLWVAASGGARDPLSAAARAWRGLFFSYRSFWGGFGWLMIWPGPGYDRVAGVISVYVVIGVVIGCALPSLLSRDPITAGLIRLCAIGAILAVATSIAGSMAGWGGDSLPQGRYLLAALVPLTVPAIALADRLLPRWGPWLVAASVLVLDAATVVGVLLPGFRPT